MGEAALARVVVRCDVGRTTGVGHLMRCLALAEEFLSRDVEVVFSADVGTVPWAAQQLRARGIAAVPGVQSPSAHVELARRTGARLMVIDSYVLPVDVYAAVRGCGVGVLALVDGDIGGREADIYLDQNLDAETRHPELPPGAVRLAGLDYALMRDEILEARRSRPERVTPGRRPEIFAFFGGTDAYGAGPVVARALVGTGLPFSATVVAGDPRLGAELSAVRLQAAQDLRVIGPTDRLVEHIREADVVLTAAGTSLWELMCLGAATGVLRVAANQRLGYDRVVLAGAAVGLGDLDQVRSDPTQATQTLARWLADPEAWHRLRTTASRMVDGEGRRRVVDAASLHVLGS